MKLYFLFFVFSNVSYCFFGISIVRDSGMSYLKLQCARSYANHAAGQTQKHNKEH